MKDLLPLVSDTLIDFEQNEEISNYNILKAKALYHNGQCVFLSQSKTQFQFAIDDEYDDLQLSILWDESAEMLTCEEVKKEKHPATLQHYFACLLLLQEELQRPGHKEVTTGKKYSREGMVRRVLKERSLKAEKAPYRISFAENPYGEHLLYNEKGRLYRITFRDLVQGTGYCSCPDYRTNKLGTCKHLMYAYNVKKKGRKRLRKARKPFPFVEIFLDPKQDYQVSWYYPDELSPDLKTLITQYFGQKTHLPDSQIRSLLGLLTSATQYKKLLVRPEVSQKIERAFDEHTLSRLREQIRLDFSVVKAQLFTYQETGVRFATFRKSVIIADEMGLGKTLQSIATALLKKQHLGFRRTLIICPASLKNQWKQEIEKFSDEQAEVVEGIPEERARQYHESEAFFLIINYETVLRDHQAINRMKPDLIVLDEAQRIKNYETLTARAIKSLHKKHGLVITGTPIENRLIDLFSIMDFLDPYLLTPLWEFSYQHCYFDPDKDHRIIGYFNLQNLKQRLEPILIRREKREVIKDLPQITELDIPVPLTFEQREYHTSFAKGVAAIIRKKYLTAFDTNRLMSLLNQMRMACNSTFLIDQETNISPKLRELQHILVEKLDLRHSKHKVIIFSEWIRMNGLIAQMLRQADIPFVELSGRVAISKRQALVNKFQEDPDCKVFISTEAGGSGLNLQAADIVINFELPWNPAKKNQRIGRMDRLGQRAANLTVLNFISRDSIEMRIASGLEIKQNLFDSVLNVGSSQDEVDFSEKGRSQFLQQIEQAIEEMLVPGQAAIPDYDTIWPAELSPELQVFEETIPETDLQPSEGAAISANPPSQSPNSTNSSSPQKAQAVLQQGMAFLDGLFQMATGQSLGVDSSTIELDEETGEVTMRFKLPKAPN